MSCIELSARATGKPKPSDPAAHIAQNRASGVCQLCSPGPQRRHPARRCAGACRRRQRGCQPHASRRPSARQHSLLACCHGHEPQRRNSRQQLKLKTPWGPQGVVALRRAVLLYRDRTSIDCPWSRVLHFSIPVMSCCAAALPPLGLQRLLCGPILDRALRLCFLAHTDPPGPEPSYPSSSLVSRFLQLPRSQPGDGAIRGAGCSLAACRALPCASGGVRWRRGSNCARHRWRAPQQPPGMRRLGCPGSCLTQQPGHMQQPGAARHVPRPQPAQPAACGCLAARAVDQRIRGGGCLLL